MRVYCIYCKIHTGSGIVFSNEDQKGEEMGACVGYDRDVFVWTRDGYKNIESLKTTDRVASYKSGVFEFSDVEEIFEDTYSGPLIRIYLPRPKAENGWEIQLSLLPDQRMFWFEEHKVKIGTAKDFYREIYSGKSLKLPIYNEDTENFFLTVDKFRIKMTNTENRRVWGVRNSNGSLVVKADGFPLIVSDVG